MSYFKQKSWKRSIVLFCKSCDSAQQLWAYFYLSRLNMEASTLFGFSPKLRPKKLKKSQNLQLTLWMFLQTADKVHSKNSSNDGTRANSQRSHLQHERQPEKILYYASDPDYAPIQIMHLIQVMDPSLILTSASCSWRCPGGQIWIGWNWSSIVS